MSVINGYGFMTPSYSRALSELRRQFDDANLQLATQQRSQTYSGLGSDRDLALSLHGKVAALDGYNTNIQQASLRTTMMATSLTSLTDIVSQTRGDLNPNNYILVDGKRTIAQQSALSRFDTAIEALNADVAGVYLFGGRDVDSRPVASASEILDGKAGQAGLRDVIAERLKADQGTDGRGRLTQATAVGPNVTLAETASPNAFGFKLGTISSNAPGNFATTTTAGPPPGVGIQVTGAPKPGDVIKVALTLPDGSTDEIKLTASNNPPAPELVAQVNGKAMPAGTLGTTTLGDPMVGLVAGDTITINGQTISVVASGAGPGQINVTDTMDDLMAGIEGLTGIQNAEFDPTTRQVRITGTNGTDLQVTGTVGNKLGVNGTVKAEEIKGYTFQIAYDATGAVDLDATAKNLASALDGAVKKEATTELVAASALEASDNFFGDPPQRVDGADPYNATALRDGTTDTLNWYLGEKGPGSPRQTQSARIDSTITAEYGARANEDGIRDFLVNLAAFATLELDPNESTGKAQYEAMTSRVRPNLSSETGLGPLESIVTEITNVQASMQSATARHKTSSAVAETMLANVEGIDKNTVAATILELQTNLQASYQVTSMAAQLSLVNYI